MKNIFCVIICLCIVIVNYAQTNLYPVKINQLWGYIDELGKVKIKPIYKQANCFRNNLALVKDSTGLYGYINNNGSYIITAEYIDGTSFYNDFAVVQNKSNEYLIINKNNRKVYSFKNTVSCVSPIINDSIVYYDYSKSYIKSTKNIKKEYIMGSMPEDVNFIHTDYFFT